MTRASLLSSMTNDLNWLTEQAYKQRKIHGVTRLDIIKVKFYGCSIVSHILKERELDKTIEEIEAIKKHVGMI